ncbi:unnamed protein product [Adineta steineri]|uniref:SH3 domain-containing protein n=1 Tax=Adineta steineri TaxID=433720 RepID=A0A814AI82_9BILA|nr:unnamed protein product [Adineta steineri]CAF3768574.1 unnamed protein product [Adineta steineri]
MAKSFFRSVTDQITGGGSKTTDIQVVQAINRSDEEHSKLERLKREFDKYTQAKLVFDNATIRFFDFICSLTDFSKWPQQRTLVQSCTDIQRTDSEYLQRVNRQINLNINSSFEIFKKMQIRIADQDRIQHDYDKTRKQYQSSIKRDEKIKVDRIKNELDQLKSALGLINSELRDELPKFHLDLQYHHIQFIKELFELNGKYHKNLYKSHTHFMKNLQEDVSTSLNNSGNVSKIETESSITDYDKQKVTYCTPLSRPKRTDYKVLHQARVVHDYKGENEDEIDLIKDEYISVISFENEEDNTRDSGWEYGEKLDGSIGLFPVNFAVRLYDNEEKQ